jgi:hypothetical protein
MSLLYISNPNKKFGKDERVEFVIKQEQDGYSATSYNFEIKMTGFNELRRWLLYNIPNYRSNEHEFGNMYGKP